MKRTARFLIVPALLLPLVCQAAAAQENRLPSPAVAAAGQDGVQRIEIVGGSYFFKPSHIIVKANAPVQLKVVKESGLMPHNIVMSSPDAGMDFTVDLDDVPRVISFTPTRPGRYPFYCTEKFPLFPSHRENGMEGVIEVLP